MHPQLQFALDRGYVEPVKIATEANPDGEPMIINGHQYFVYTNNGEKLTQSRLYAFSDFIEESNRFVARREDLETGMQLIDEVLTPDSSRFWPADQYEPGHGQPSYDKQFVRDWLETTGWDKNSPPPALPDDVVNRTRAKYVEAYKKLWNLKFPW